MRTVKALGRDQDRDSRERDAAWRNFDPPQFEWDEGEVSAIVDDIVVQHSCAE